jgi:GNAT superfamily N-acetyltransferase
MRIRKATPGDAEAASLMLRRSIRELWVRDHENDPVTLASWLANKTPEKFREWAEAADDFCCVAAGDDGAILGVAYLAKSGEIRLNYVSPDARFQGVSGALIAAMEAQAMRWASRDSSSKAPPLPIASIWSADTGTRVCPRRTASRTISIHW